LNPCHPERSVILKTTQCHPEHIVILNAVKDLLSDRILHDTLKEKRHCGPERRSPVSALFSEHSPDHRAIGEASPRAPTDQSLNIPLFRGFP
jgi:hypothetical protein